MSIFSKVRKLLQGTTADVSVIPLSVIPYLFVASVAALITQPSFAQRNTGNSEINPETLSPEAKAAIARRTGGKAADPAPARGPRIDYSLRAEVQEFINEMVSKHQFNEDELKPLFAAVRFEESVVRLMTPAAPNFKRSWEVYRRRFIDATRINAGVEFWKTHAQATKRASDVYGVPEEIIMAIIGVETVFGRVTGDYRVMDALTILTFDYPRRAEFFRGELENFLLFTREMQIKPFTVKGSYAGAIGLPQFMPSSIRRYATDFDGDGQIDLRGSPSDAIGSVAKFLAGHGWRAGEAIVFDVKLQNNAKLQELIAAGIEPKFSALELADSGIEVQGDVPSDMKLALIDLPNGDNPTTYMAGPRNFYVITRYNRSSFYAMAVRDLALSLLAAKKRQ
jgi:membrane-bound lytic murein transglycosylase B